MENDRKKGITVRAATWFLAAVMLLVFGCNLDNPPDGESPDGETKVTHNEMLETLGLNTDLGNAEDPDGNPVPDGYNPLGRVIAPLNRQVEIFLTGITYGETGDIHEILIDDGNTDYATLKSSNDESTTSDSNLFATEAGDVDGNGQEEVLILMYNTDSGKLLLKVVEDEADDYSTGNPVELATVTPPEWDTWQGYYKIDIAAGDLDGDSKEEVVVVCYGQVIILDDIDQNFQALATKAFPTISAQGNMVVRVAVGEIDGDGKDDIVVVEGINDDPGACYFHVFSGTDFSVIEDDQIVHPTIDGTSYNFEYANVAVGDFDGDALNEIAFCGDGQGFGNNMRVLIADDYRESFAWLQVTYSAGYTWGDNFVPATETLDIDGDGQDELLASNSVVGIADGALTELETTKYPFRIPAVGDITGDRKAEVISMDWGNHDIYVQGYDSSDSWSELEVLRNTCESDSATICAANVDSDSPVVKYTGEHELLFTDPTVIAVLACPPYHGDSGQNIDACGTTYGTSTSTGVEEATSIGFSVGVSVGYDFDVPFIAGASLKVTVEAAMDWIASNSLTIEKSIAYSSGSDEDKVIFTAVPFDVYYYEILSSPESSTVGTRICINVPRNMQTLSVSRTFYNANNGDCPDIGSSVLAHTIGDVSSYPTPIERESLQDASNSLKSELGSVGVGTGEVTVTISRSEETGSGVSANLSVTIETEAEIGDFTVGASAGFHYGYEYSITNTQATFYEGTVGDIPEDEYNAAMAYQFGLFTYPYKLESQEFTVVNYWVE